MDKELKKVIDEFEEMYSTLTENACKIVEATNGKRGDFYTCVLNYCRYGFEQVMESNKSEDYKKQEIGFLTNYLEDVGKGAIETCRELNVEARKNKIEYWIEERVNTFNSLYELAKENPYLSLNDREKVYRCVGAFKEDINNIKKFSKYADVVDSLKENINTAIDVLDFYTSDWKREKDSLVDSKLKELNRAKKENRKKNER